MNRILPAYLRVTHGSTFLQPIDHRHVLLPLLNTVLHDDVKRIQLNFSKAYAASKGQENQEHPLFYARQLIRALSAYFEAAIYVMKVDAADTLAKHKAITKEELWYAHCTEYYKKEVDPKLRPLERKDDFEFAINLQCRIHNLEPIKRAEVPWFNEFLDTMKIRDRLTHPKTLEDLNVTDKDLVNCQRAHDGFFHMLEWFIGFDSRF